jgi:transketolase
MELLRYVDGDYAEASTFEALRVGRVIGIHTFGSSAPLKELQRKFGFEPERVVAVAKEVLG